MTEVDRDAFPGWVRANPVYRLLYQAFREKMTWIIGATAANFLSAIFEGGTLGLTLVAIQVLAAPDAQAHIAEKLPIAQVAGLVMRMDRMSLFIVIIVAAIILQALRSMLGLAASNATVVVATYTQSLLQRRVYGQIMRLGFPCVSRYRIGDLADLVVTPPKSATDLLTLSNTVLIDGLTVVVYGVLLLMVSPVLTVLALPVFGLAALFQRSVLRKIRDRSIELSHAGARLATKLVETIHGIRLVHVFHRYEHVSDDISASIDDVAAYNHRMWRVITILGPLAQTLTVASVGVFLILGVMVLRVADASSLAKLLTFTLVLNRLAARANALPMAIGDIARQFGQLQRLETILRDDDKEFLATGGTPFLRLREGISFRNVSLTYPGKQEAAIDGVTFEIPRGKVTAIVGGSGAGKSTLIDLLARLYEPSAGSIDVDGENVTRYSLMSWRDALGVVSQDTFLFNATIRENIRFGLPETSDAAIRDAVRIANALEFIEALPEGFDTVVGEGGHGLSGGQRQRIALARAILRQPQILVLDEATSALDSASERLIQDALEAFGKDRTVVVVAHRLSTISRADQIVLIENGRIVEQGGHQELVAAGGHYASYWALQSATVS